MQGEVNSASSGGSKLRSVREQAVFWMGQVHTDKAAEALEAIATSSPDMALREKAIFARVATLA